MYGDNFTPIAELRPVDENSENCLIGGGELNVLAGATLIRHDITLPTTVVCAYGGRSRYLTEIPGAPSEAEIMTFSLAAYFPWKCPATIVWPRDHQATSGKTNTDQELANIFKLAVARGYEHVGVVTVFVHYARTILMASRHLLKPAFAHLKLQCFVSEQILIEHTWGVNERIRDMHASQAFTRTLFYEQRGINALLAGKY